MNCGAHASGLGTLSGVFYDETVACGAVYRADEVPEAEPPHKYDHLLLTSMPNSDMHHRNQHIL